MRLSYGQLETVLAGHLQVHPDKVPTLRSRIKQLQRLQFPPGVNVGRGLKMEYTSEHLFMLITAFELIGIGLPAATACNLVNEHWRHFAAGYALAALEERRLDDKEEQGILAIIWAQSFYEIQFSKGAGRPRPSEISIRDEVGAQSELRPYDFNRHQTRIIISLRSILRRVLKLARDVAGVEGASCYDEDFNPWLPKGTMAGINFSGRYPDRSNIEIRREIHSARGNDPDSLTPDGVEEANDFARRNFSDDPGF